MSKKKCHHGTSEKIECLQSWWAWISKNRKYKTTIIKKEE